MSVLTNEEKKRVEQAVTLAEKKTSGEIVVCSVGQSGLYRWIYGECALLGWLFGTVGAFVFEPWGPSALHVLVWQAATSLVIVLLVQIPALRRLFVRKKELANRVHESAQRIFLESGTLKTRDRTGVLIYVSEFEHRVEILADVGIHSVAGDSYWKEQVEHIVSGIRAGKACDALCTAINEIGDKLATNFPPRPDDSNELPNRPL